MILQRYITQWQEQAPWPDMEQIEHDLVLSRAICELYSSTTIAENLVFRGGTALHKLFFKEAGRFSEDLDFVQKTAMPIGDTVTAIRDCLDPWLGKPKWKQGRGRFTLYYRFETETEPVISRKVKIEINTREHFHVLPYKEIEYHVKSDWYEGSVTILTYQLEELLGTKLRALYQRRKGRDLFDFWYANKELGNIDFEAVTKIFLTYMQEGKTPVTYKQYRDNLALKRENEVFNKDIMALLPQKIVKQYDLNDAYNLLFSLIIPNIERLGSKLSVH